MFLKECPIRCSWCSNPESIVSSPEIVFRAAKCIKCGRCIDVCAEQAIEILDNVRTINWQKWNHCARCADICPARGWI